MSIMYQLTEEQYRALMNELKLEKFCTPDQFCADEVTRKAQENAVSSMHRRFVYHIETALRGKP